MPFLKYFPRKRCSFTPTISYHPQHHCQSSTLAEEATLEAKPRVLVREGKTVVRFGGGGDWPSRPRSVTRPWLKLTNKTRNNCKIGTHSDLNRRRTLVIGWGRDSLQPIGRGSHFFSRRAAGPRVLHILAVPRRAWVHYYLQHCTRNTVHEVFLRMLKQLQVSIAPSQHEYCCLLSEDQEASKHHNHDGLIVKSPNT